MVTIYDIRRENFRRLSLKYKTKKAFADALCYDDSIVSRVLSDTNPVNIGDRLARYVEVVLDLERGALDNPNKIKVEENVTGGIRQKFFSDIPVIDVVRGPRVQRPYVAITHYRKLDATKFLESGVEVKNVRLYEVRNDELFPDYRQGTLIALDVSAPLEDGRLFAVRYDSAFGMFRVFRQLNGNLLLKPINDMFPSYEIDHKDEELKVEVVGRAFLAPYMTLM